MWHLGEHDLRIVRQLERIVRECWFERNHPELGDAVREEIRAAVAGIREIRDPPLGGVASWHTLIERTPTPEDP